MEIFFETQGKLTVVIDPAGGNSNTSKFFMHVLVTCKYQEHVIYNNQEKVETRQQVKSLKI